jgi:AAA+ ATPase superfamily predicted ATPase
LAGDSTTKLLTKLALAFFICSGEYNAQRFVEFLFQLFELTAGGISKDEAQRIAANLAKVPEVLWKSGNA